MENLKFPSDLYEKLWFQFFLNTKFQFFYLKSKNEIGNFFELNFECFFLLKFKMRLELFS